MNLNTALMAQYAQFLEEHSRSITALCGQLEERLSIAVQCMDQQSGRGAAARMVKNIENVKASTPLSDDACSRLLSSMKRVGEAGQIFGG